MTLLETRSVIHETQTLSKSSLNYYIWCGLLKVW